MKLNLVSLVSFFAIANTVNGQFLRVDKEQQNRVTTVQEQDAKPVATLDLDDNGARVEYFDDGDGIIIMGTGANADVKKMDLSTTLNELSPVESFEQLSGKAAPADLVNAQKRIEQLMGTPSTKTIPPPPPADDATSLEDSRTKVGITYVYDQCNWYYYRTGNDHYYVATNNIWGRVEPYRGCVGMKTDKWNGSSWVYTGVTTYRACAGEYNYVRTWGPYLNYGVRIIDAVGDGYDVQVCWD